MENVPVRAGEKSERFGTAELAHVSGQLSQVRQHHPCVSHPDYRVEETGNAAPEIRSGKGQVVLHGPLANDFRILLAVVGTFP